MLGQSFWPQDLLNFTEIKAHVQVCYMCPMLIKLITKYFIEHKNMLQFFEFFSMCYSLSFVRKIK